ncbi:MAG: TRAP transporter substrate-binding protein DctP [Gemmatimonadetes bacterium]|jgi:TRAP-type transport system periplasmic protein|nr:TRAP transporter substrate-binding protein DctP [Gemmatimonadota bacterium]MBT7858659.1 TRAP transporter substrate-binding protein DctP [Gemmatimonadota bacterium]
MSYSEIHPRRGAVILLIGLGLVLSSIAPVQAIQLLKVATIAPEGSGWVRALREVDAELRQKTDDAVGLKIYPGGVQGDEDVMLRKMRIGQLHGGSFGGRGVSLMAPDVLALEMPFLFDNYDEVDYVVAQMDAFYRERFAEGGYVLLGWSDIGFVHVMSQKPVRGAADIKGMKVWRLADEPITAVLFRRAGVTSVPLTISDVLLGLQTHLIDVVYASPSAAIVLQWFTRVKYLTALPINYTVGVFALQRKVFDRLDPSHQQTLLDITSRHFADANHDSRQDNEEAMQVIIDQGIIKVEPLEEEIQSFIDLVVESRPELVGHAFSQEAYDLVNQHLTSFRESPAVGPGDE